MNKMKVALLGMVPPPPSPHGEKDPFVEWRKAFERHTEIGIKLAKIMILLAMITSISGVAFSLYMLMLWNVILK